MINRLKEKLEILNIDLKDLRHDVEVGHIDGEEYEDARTLRDAYELVIDSLEEL